MANLQTLLPMLYSEGVLPGRITLRRLVEVLSHRPAFLAGLAGRKGTIAVGYDADLVVFDPELRRPVRSSDLVSNADHDPFDGWSVTGWPVTVLCRGRVVHRDGERIDAAGHGRWLPRSLVRVPSTRNVA
jgi:dihydropyrimidinase